MKIYSKTLIEDIYSFDENIEFEVLIGLNPELANEQHHELVPISNIELYNKLEFEYLRNFFYEGYYGAGVANQNNYNTINRIIIDTVLDCWDNGLGIDRVPRIVDANCNFGELADILESIYENMFKTSFHELSELTVASKTAIMGREFDAKSFYDMTGTSHNQYDLWIAKVIYGS